MNVFARNFSQNLLRYNRIGLVQAAAAARSFSASATEGKEIEKLVKNNKVVVFMKGNPEAPRCGFSNAVVQILRMHSVNYDSHDVLLSEELRQGIKDFSNWPTIPQVFINGEFVGGCDILLQMHQNGELIEELKKAGIESALVKEGEK
uniref:Glutaredoxin-related protein 5, mitochondrial n=1 Tax=Anopheles triannulatus TaxID=58253 RepID=A0A2M4APM0_9DIPT